MDLDQRGQVNQQVQQHVIGKFKDMEVQVCNYCNEHATLISASSSSISAQYVRNYRIYNKKKSMSKQNLYTELSKSYEPTQPPDSYNGRKV